MPSFVSVLGKFHPAEEVVQLQLSQEDLIAGKNPVYRGADRASLSLLVEQGYAKEDKDGPIHYSGDDPQYVGKRYKIIDYPGRDIRTEPDLIRQSRELGFKSVPEYLHVMHGVDIEEAKATQEKLLGNIINHDKVAVRKPDPIGAHEKSGPGPYKKGGFGESGDPQSEAILKGKA